jgi:hypothetical protein
MKRLIQILSALCLSLLCSGLAAAQNAAAPPPPPILLITREDIRPGKMAAHAEEAMANVRVMANSNKAMTNKELHTYRIGMSPIAGNQNEVTYISPYASFADMENRAREIDRLASGPMKADYDGLPDRELHAAQMDVIAGFRPDLSYGVGNVDAAQSRYMVITTLRLKPGHEDEYWDGVKKYVNPARDKTPLKAAASYAVYQVRGGMAGPTFITIRPLKSLAELDTASANLVRPAMSAEDRKMMDEITDRTVVGSTTIYYAFNPRISLVSPEFAARDKAATAFWITTPAPAAATTASAAAPRPAKRQR